ncbi:hypothetical protein TeGR_g3731, partial [Tetraparma gracilis]
SLPLPPSPYSLVATRPLTAYPSGGVGDASPLKLVDHVLLRSSGVPTSSHLLPPGTVLPTYEGALRNALGHFDVEPLVDKLAGGPLSDEEQSTLEGARLLQGLVVELDKSLSSVTSVAEHDRALRRDVVPAIHGSFEEMDETTAHVLAGFFAAHSEQVRLVTAHRTREMAGRGGHEVPGGEAVHEYALKWAAGRDGVDAVSCELSTVAYVEEVLGRQ